MMVLWNLLVILLPLSLITNILGIYTSKRTGGMILHPLKATWLLAI